MDWQSEQARLAAKRQADLQAAADATAAKERDKLLAQAAKAKKPETVAAKLEQAAAVIAPTVIVAAPKAVKTRKVWIVKAVDHAAFFAAVARDESLRGYIEINMTAMTRGKAANVMMTIPGVVFEQVEQ